VVICQERGVNDLHMVQLMPLPPHRLCLIKIPISLTFVVPAYPGCPGKKAVKRVSVIYSISLLQRQPASVLTSNQIIYWSLAQIKEGKGLPILDTERWARS